MRRRLGTVGTVSVVLALATTGIGTAASQERVVSPGGPASLGSLRSLIPLVAPRRTPRGQPYRLMRWRVRLDRMTLALAELGRRETFPAALRRTGGLLLVNGGFFDQRGRPMGIAVSDGRALGRLSHEVRGAVLLVRGGRASLHHVDQLPSLDGAEFAIQAKPRLVVDGRAVDIRSTPRPADRTALCIRRGGEVVDVYVARSGHPRARGGPTLSAFARALERAGCEQALNLDGGRSTGAAWREGPRTLALPPRVPVHQLLVVRPRP